MNAHKKTMQKSKINNHHAVWWQSCKQHKIERSAHCDCCCSSSSKQEEKLKQEKS